MARVLNKLTAASLKRAIDNGKFKPNSKTSDGGGLYINCASGGTLTYVVILTKNGKRRELGLGSVHSVTLAKAREKADELRRQAADGLDVLEVKRAASQKAMTMFQCAEAYIVAKQAGWKDPKQVRRWRQLITSDAFKAIGDKTVRDVNVADVLKAVVGSGLWEHKPPTGRYLISILYRVIGWAGAHSHRDANLANPASWDDVLVHVMSSPKPGGHHSAMPYAGVATFVKSLRELDTVYARATELVILTWSRRNEVRLMRWNEVDFAKAIWTVPASRMKAGREHQVPLTKRALEILRMQHALTGSDPCGLVFVTKRGGQIGDSTMLRLVPAPHTLHGFRSSARDWAGDCTNHEREIAEGALAHAIGNAVERAYRRTTAIEKRGALLKDWATYLT